MVAWVVMVLVAALPAAARDVPLGGGMRLRQQGDTVRLILGAAQIPLSLDESCVGCRLMAARLVATAPGGAVIIRATYASRPAFPERQCGGGEEEVVHVVARRPARREAAAWRMASCWRSIEPSERTGDLAWDPVTSSLTLERVIFQADAFWLERRRWHLPPDGSVREEGGLHREPAPPP